MDPAPTNQHITAASGHQAARLRRPSMSTHAKAAPTIKSGQRESKKMVVLSMRARGECLGSTRLSAPRRRARPAEPRPEIIEQLRVESGVPPSPERNKI